MKPPRTIWYVALLTLVFSAFAVPAGAAWQCEGRECGITPWACCCGPTAPVRSSRCVPVTIGKRKPGCPEDCRCVMVMRSSDASRAEAVSRIAPHSSPAVLTLGDRPVLSFPAAVAARAFPRRGPPLRASAFASPYLRGPPSRGVSLLRL